MMEAYNPVLYFPASGTRPYVHREEVTGVRPYEMMMIVSADLEDPKEEIAKVEEVVRTLGGEVAKTDVWGKRRFAYPIRKKQEGVYSLTAFFVEPDRIVELKRLLGLRQNVMRTMIVCLDEE
mgnify:CR=1 FL=1